ncbi:MAG: ABC transporter permease [Candidatus Baldrarchaeia archaeon]
MKIGELKQGVKMFLNEFRRYKIGIAGLILLTLFSGIAIFAPLLAPYESYKHWNDQTYWEDVPPAVPPAWTNFFSSKKVAEQYEVENPPLEMIGNWTIATIEYDYKYDIPPKDILVKLQVQNLPQPIKIIMEVVRPDNLTVLIYSSFCSGGEMNKIFISGDPISRKLLIDFAKQYETEENIESAENREISIKVLRILFSKAGPGMLIGSTPPLKGTYIFRIKFSGIREEQVNYLKMVFKGGVYGIIGTTRQGSVGKDLFVGLVWGTRLALIIGLSVAVISTVVGVLYGVVSAYLGGWVDEIMQRIQEIVASIPLLPILLILSFLFKPTVWHLVILMIIFYWTGPVKTVRSMALQIKEQPYVEAARALGASSWRIIARYVMPQIIPYMFASIALGVPGAILTEAGVSFLVGAQTATEPTWGKILSEAYSAGASISGYWWWIITPGILLTLTGLTFVFVGYALDKILSPTLKK